MGGGSGEALVSEVPASTLDTTAPDFAENPYPAFEALRAAGPVSWHEGMQRYLVTGWREAMDMLLDPRSFESPEEGFVALFGGRTMECMDRPRHAKVRGIWARDFDPCPIDAMEALVRRVIAPRLETFAARVRDGETVDAVATMTRGIPTIVIAELLGIDSDDHERFAAWSDAMGDMGEGLTRPGPRGKALIAQAAAATRSLNDYVRARLDERRARPGADLVSRMLAAPAAADMEEDEIVASNTQLVFAGNETTAKLMAIALIELAHHPDQRAALACDPTLIGSALEEIHRRNTVVQINGRRTRGGNARIAGHSLPDGAHVTILQGAVNRDPARWDRPDRLDIHRAHRNHMGFGAGMHVCLGMHLARLESRIWLEMLMAALPEWEIVAADWGTNWTVRGPLRLEVARI